MINITTTKNNEFYGAIRRVNYETLIAIATVEGVEKNFEYLNPNLTSTLKETEKRKGEVVQMYLNISFGGTSLVGLPSYGPCEFDIPVCGGDFSLWTSGAGTQSHMGGGGGGGGQTVCTGNVTEFHSEFSSWPDELHGDLDWSLTVNGSIHSGNSNAHDDKADSMTNALESMVGLIGIDNAIIHGNVITATGKTDPCQKLSDLSIVYIPDQHS